MLPNLKIGNLTAKYPIIQGGMVWCSGWKLASAVSNNGGLGLLGAGSMHPEILVEHIRQMQKATSNPWGVNVPLLYPEIDRLIQILIEEKVKIPHTQQSGETNYFTFAEGKWEAGDAQHTWSKKVDPAHPEATYYEVKFTGHKLSLIHI